MKRDRYKLNKEFEKIASTAKRSMAVVTASLTTATVASVNFADSINTNAKNASLSVVEFQRLNGVFHKFGLETEDLVSLSRNLAVRLVELKEGSASTKEMFDRLNLSGQDFGTNMEENLLVVIDALHKTENAVTRTATASDLLGGEGERIASITEAGAPKIRAMADEIESFGLVSKEAANNGTTLKQTVADISTTIKNNFTEGLLGGIDTSQDFTTQIKQLGEAAKSVGSVVAETAKFFAEWHKEIGLLLGLIAAGKLLLWMKSLAALAGGAAGAIGGASVAGSLVLGLMALKAAIVAIVGVGAFATLLQLMKDIARTGKEMNVQLEKAKERIDALPMSDLQRNIRFALTNINRLKREIQQAEETGANRSFIESLNAELEQAVKNTDLLLNKMSAMDAQRIQKATMPDWRPPFPIDIDLPPAMNYRGARVMEKDHIGRRMNITGRMPDQTRIEEVGRIIADAVEKRIQAGSTIMSQSQVSAGRHGRAKPRLAGGRSGIALQINEDLKEMERRREEMRKLTKEISDSFRGSMREAFRSGDFSKVGSTLVDGIKNALSDRLADKVSDMFENFLDSIFDKAFSGGGPGGGLFGGGGILGAIGGFFGGIFHSGLSGGTRGIVPGKPGDEKLVLARAGEEISLPHQRRGGNIRTNYNMETDVRTNIVNQNNYFQTPMNAAQSQYTQMMMPFLEDSAAGAIA